jgi:hypothetical protein
VVATRERIFLDFRYDAALQARLKSELGATFEPLNKQWVVGRQHASACRTLLEDFGYDVNGYSAALLSTPSSVLRRVYALVVGTGHRVWGIGGEVVTALVASVICSQLLPSDQPVVLRVALDAVFAVAVGGLCLAVHNTFPDAWAFYRRVVVGLVVHGVQVPVAVLRLLTGASLATRAQIKAQSNLVSRTRRGFVVWCSKAGASRNIRALKRAGRA